VRAGQHPIVLVLRFQRVPAASRRPTAEARHTAPRAPPLAPHTGQNFTLATIGGSIAAGHGNGAALPFVRYLHNWVHDTFKPPGFRFHNGAVPGVASAYMSLCVELHVPRAADLVLVEYAVNDASEDGRFDTPALRAFERLLRKLLRLPNSPAIVLINAYAMLFTPPRGRYWASAEAHFFELATYYSLPLLSLKACCFHLLVEGRPPFSIDGTANNASLQGRAFYHDPVHPDGLTGHRVLAELPMQLLQQTADELRRGESEGGAAGARQTRAQQRSRLRCVPVARAIRSSEA